MPSCASGLVDSERDVLVLARDAGGTNTAIYRLDPRTMSRCSPDPARATAAAMTGPRPAADRFHGCRQDERPAREPDARHPAGRSVGAGEGRADHHAARHRLERILVLVRRPAARDGRVEVDHRKLCLGDGHQVRRATARAACSGRRCAQDIDERVKFLSTERDVSCDRSRRRITA